MKACRSVVEASLSEARPLLGKQRQRGSCLDERKSHLSQSSAQGYVERLIHLGFLKRVGFLTTVCPRKDASLTQSHHKAAVL